MAAPAQAGPVYMTSAQYQAKYGSPPPLPGGSSAAPQTQSSQPVYMTAQQYQAKYGSPPPLPKAPQAPAPQASPFPLENIASGNSGANIQMAIGAAKGLLQNAIQVGGVGGSNPVVNGMLANAPGFSQDIQDAKAASQTTNPLQQGGAVSSDIATALIGPGGAEGGDAIGAALQDARVQAAPKIAEEIASAPNTKKNVLKGLLSMAPNPQSAKDADAIQPLVEQGLLGARTSAKQTLMNVAVLKDEIGNTAQSLVGNLRSMDVKPTIQPEDLKGLITNAMSEIDKNVPPSGQTAAKSTAQWIWSKFIDNLPKGQDLTAEDVLKARQQTDAEVQGIKGQNVFDPATETGFSVALRALRQGANELVASKAGSDEAGQAVKDSLSHQTSLYNVMENVAEKGAQAVKKANDIANLPGVAGIIARHPYTVGAPLAGAGTALSGLLGGAGALEGAKALGFNPQQLLGGQ
jgi:hypothetical protein